MRNALWHVEVNPRSGGLMRIAHPDDAHAMNWVCEPGETPAYPEANGWGMGYLVVPGRLGPQRWQVPISVVSDADSVCSEYQVSGVKVSVRRRLIGASLEERFVFHNPTNSELVSWGGALFVPFNDNYPDAQTCLNGRCNAHVWCGGHVAHVCALRMGGGDPHLGLVLLRGEISGYSIFDRGTSLGGSNLRGSIALILPGFTLAPGATREVAWRLFWHTGEADFYQQARQVPGFVGLQAGAYTVERGKSVRVDVTHPTFPGDLALTGPTGTTITALTGGGEGTSGFEVQSETFGDLVLQAEYGAGQKTWVRLHVVPSVGELVRARVRFILENQQVNDPSVPWDGAFVCYDNLAETPFRNAHWADQNEGRERLGMGVLLALWAAREPSVELEQSLRRYHAFVRTRLQLADGTVLNGVGDDHQRLYNYTWVAHLHLELFHTYGDPGFLDDFLATLRAFYKRGGGRFYCIGLPIHDGIVTLRAASRESDAEEMLTHFRAHADCLVGAGRNFPPHEVNYEQTIVCPSVWIPLEFYLVTGEEPYLAHARKMLPVLEAFEGKQPDHHLNGIAIRHWDGFWFGRRRLWGDTFPHYWSSTSGIVYHLYAKATGDQDYARRAQNTLRNNLSLFTPAGRASCAYLYPDSINGEPGRLADELANDQDWALVNLLKSLN